MSNCKYILKVVIAGDSGVGKSSFMARYVDDTFSYDNESTIGVDFKVKNLDYRGDPVKLQIWDTAGQERFNSITCSYFRGAHAVIFVFDLTRKETLDHIEKWYDDVRGQCPDHSYVPILVGNKSDLTLKRDVSAQQVKDLIEKLASDQDTMTYVEVSAKKGERLDDVFQSILDHTVGDETKKNNYLYKHVFGYRKNVDFGYDDDDDTLSRCGC
jgi:small GTP-binding protein